MGWGKDSKAERVELRRKGDRGISRGTEVGRQGREGEACMGGEGEQNERENPAPRSYLKVSASCKWY